MSDVPEVREGPEARDEPEALDDKVLRLRGEGQTFARISRDLELDRGADAQRAFVRALRTLPASDADRVRAEEMSRLDRLAEHVRADTRRNDTDRARQLRSIERLRSRVIGS